MTLVMTLVNENKNATEISVAGEFKSSMASNVRVLGAGRDAAD
jgi:hypothetical protein